MSRNLWLLASGLVALLLGDDGAALVYGAGLMSVGLVLIELRGERFWENSQN